MTALIAFALGFVAAKVPTEWWAFVWSLVKEGWSKLKAKSAALRAMRK